MVYVELKCRTHVVLGDQLSCDTAEQSERVNTDVQQLTELLDEYVPWVLRVTHCSKHASLIQLAVWLLW